MDGLLLRSALLLVPALAGLGLRSLFAAEPSAHVAEIERFHQSREASLKADDGWLTVAGLFWLRPGETRFGSDPSSDVLLPPSAPAHVGALTLDPDGRATFRAAPDAKVTLDGKPFTSGPIQSDAHGQKPSILAVGDLRLILIMRGDRHALRLKDNASALRRDFAGLRWFPVSESYKVDARFVPAPSKTTILLDTIVGEQDALPSPGHVEFTLDGKPYRLTAATEGDTLWFVFRDATSGRTTAGNARQLNIPLPKDGRVTLDFNKAVNLPCSYTPFATCPLAPPQNRLPIPIEAGEKKYEAKPIESH